MQVKWMTQPQKAWKRYPWCSAGWFCAMVWLLAGDAWAANSSTIQATEAYATIHHMGLYVAYGGDDNQGASALVVGSHWVADAFSPRRATPCHQIHFLATIENVPHKTGALNA